MTRDEFKQHVLKNNLKEQKKMFGFYSEQDIIPPYIMPRDSADWHYMVDNNFENVRVMLDLAQVTLLKEYQTYERSIPGYYSSSVLGRSEIADNRKA